jgi:hypothetical protein
VFATFGETNCEGVFAWSFYREPHVTGGSLNLRCDDGSLLAAAAGVERDEDTGDGLPHVHCLRTARTSPADYSPA